ncbi:hypothetical protein [Rhodococcus globerulus]|uniref:hypothetical protein n=1 Tax=Rhodococcus globerulus TaxID=33008 RepID=UPI001C59FDA2|nr:hypothetical protein [Rhodococcus globerulus]QXW04007.1 hypothetical protein KYT97_08305 [Rhodococcus globerulus]
MPMIDIIAEHDPRVQVTFNVPIKGRQNPLIFSVPMIQYMSKDDSEAFREWFLKAREEETLTTRTSTLKLLGFVTSAKDFAILEKLADGTLNQISDKWEEASKVTPGESSASSDT